MKKFIVFAAILVGIFCSISIAEDLRFYDQFNVYNLPAGATIYLTIESEVGFTLGSSTETIHSYSTNLVIPRSIKIGSYDVQVSSANVFCIRHGEYLLK